MKKNNMVSVCNHRQQTHKFIILIREYARVNEKDRNNDFRYVYV